MYITDNSAMNERLSL